MGTSTTLYCTAKYLPDPNSKKGGSKASRDCCSDGGGEKEGDCATNGSSDVASVSSMEEWKELKR